jgi:hypothetical protein
MCMHIVSQHACHGVWLVNLNVVSLCSRPLSGVCRELEAHYETSCLALSATPHHFCPDSRRCIYWYSKLDRRSPLGRVSQTARFVRSKWMHFMSPEDSAAAFLHPIGHSGGTLWGACCLECNDRHDL